VSDKLSETHERRIAKYYSSAALIFATCSKEEYRHLFVTRCCSLWLVSQSRDSCLMISQSRVAMADLRDILPKNMRFWIYSVKLSTALQPIGACYRYCKKSDIDTCRTCVLLYNNTVQKKSYYLLRVFEPFGLFFNPEIPGLGVAQCWCR